MSVVKKSSLQSLLQGTPLPDLPPIVTTPMEMQQYIEQEVIWKRKLVEYLRRLLQSLTGPNIWNEIIQQVPQSVIDLIVAQASTKLGFGPVKIEVFPGYVYVDGTTAFPGGDPVGTWYDTGLRRDSDVTIMGFGREDGGAGEFTAIRITCKVTPDFTENYKFNVITDDFFRLYVNNNLELDKWDTSTGITGDIALTAATPATIRFEVVNTGGPFNWRLQWRSTSQTSGADNDIPYSKISAP